MKELAMKELAMKALTMKALAGAEHMPGAGAGQAVPARLSCPASPHARNS